MFLSAVYFHEMHKYLRDYKMFKIMSINKETHKCKNNSIIIYRNNVFFNLVSLNSIHKYQDNFTNVYVFIDYEKIYLKFCTLYRISNVNKENISIMIQKDKYMPIIPKYVKNIILFNTTNRIEYFNKTLFYHNDYNIFYSKNKICNIKSKKLNKLIDKNINNYILTNGNNSYKVNGDYLIDISVNEYDILLNILETNKYDDYHKKIKYGMSGYRIIPLYQKMNDNNDLLQIYFRFTKFLNDFFCLNNSINQILIDNDILYTRIRCTKCGKNTDLDSKWGISPDLKCDCKKYRRITHNRVNIISRFKLYTSYKKYNKKNVHNEIKKININATYFK